MTFKSRINAGFGGALAVLILVGVLSFQAILRGEEDRRWLTHTHVVLEKLDAVAADVTDAETGQRGYILTGEESYLKPYNDALGRVHQNVKALRDLTADNSIQQRSMDRLEPSIELKLTELQHRIEIRDREGLAGAVQAEKEGTGALHMRQIRERIAEMKQEENQLLVQRTAELDASSHKTRLVVAIGSVLAFVFLLLANIVVQQEMARRQRADDELRKLNADLERRVTERTAELAERAQDLARSNAELQQFAYVASHDLQEPLRMVASFTQLLAKRYAAKLDDDAREFISYAVDGATRLQTRITDLLAYSRVGTQGKSFEPTPCDDVLNRVLSGLKLAIKESGAVITKDPLPVVMGDGGQLGQLFQNFLTNAMKFRGEKPPRVQISAERNGGLWKISVRDNGIGFSQEHAERIFIIFQRLHTKAEYPGTGIGLSICKKIVERHGGRIWVESSPGGGSTFCFTIPGAEIPKGEEIEQNDLRVSASSR